MANRRLSMIKIRKILKYFYEKKLSKNSIRKIIGISRDSVTGYLYDFKKSGLTYKETLKMNDESLLEIFEKRPALSSNKRYQELYKLFPSFTEELKKTGVNRQLLWEEYKQENPKGYNYSQFCHHYNMWSTAEKSLTMHIEHKAGDKMFVDYTGKKMSITNRITGEIREVEIFVAILGASSLTYVIATETQQKHDWISANENALHYFGGVPQAIVPDCLKSGVHKANKYEPDINPNYADFAEHYDTAILPRPVHIVQKIKRWLKEL
jgi:transposase